MSQTTITPHDQSSYVTRDLSDKDTGSIVDKAVEAQRVWKKVEVNERIAIGRKFIVNILDSLTGV